MSHKITLDFDKHTMNKGAINILSNGLQDDPERDVIMLSLKECLAKMAKGNKLPYKAANYLLVNILNAITIEGSNTSDEIRLDTHPDPQVEPEDQSQWSQDGSEETTQGPTSAPSGSGQNLRAVSNPDQNSPSKQKKETCRFYTRGHCNRGKDCRFDHPSICKKFRQFGSKSTDKKGCDGKCSAFHLPAVAPSRIGPAPLTNAGSSTSKAQRGPHLTKTRATPGNQPPKGTAPNPKIAENKRQKTGRPVQTRRRRNPKTIIPIQPRQSETSERKSTN